MHRPHYSSAHRRLSVSVAAALLVGCGTAPPIGAPFEQARKILRLAGNGSSYYQVVYGLRKYPDGANPEAALIDVNGTLYGTTCNGGSHHRGTVFSVNTAGTEHVLHSFGIGEDGQCPSGSLIYVKGTFYGTTLSGGAYYGLGTVFTITAAGTEHVLHTFGSGSDGWLPAASLIDVNGTLYGTTTSGGLYGDGTVFSITTTGAEGVLHSFGSGADGQDPTSSLVDVNGTLYGTTFAGGKYDAPSGGDGTVFSISTAGTEQVLHNFGGGSDGRFPAASLIGVKGTLYGTTGYGGKHGSINGGYGTVFTMSTTGAEHVLYSFGAHLDGHNPAAALIDVNGTLYGTTRTGGKYDSPSGGDGTVLRISTTGTEQILHSFGGRLDGQYPSASLTDVRGSLYGTTYAGGAYGRGAVFSLRIAE
jgi:uncharacterized repeat protein (TIGR03803 family)